MGMWSASKLAAVPSIVPVPQLRVLEIPGTTLVGNPLRDPVVRHAAVFVPGAGSSLREVTVVYYLPGFGDSCESFIANPDRWLRFVGDLEARGLPIVFVVVDGRTRWGCSQYLDSPAQGDYATYVAEEVVDFVEQELELDPKTSTRVIAGHSSGGFGALRLGMRWPDRFGTIIALSPDSDFPDTHRPLVELPAVRAATPADIDAIVAEKDDSGLDGDLDYIIALCAAYTPTGAADARAFEWLYDDRHAFREDVWKRWLANDPLTLVAQDAPAFQPTQRVYLDGAALDEFKANIGARKVYEVLKHSGARTTFHEPPGHHGDHLPERITRGLDWAANLPVEDLP